MFAPQSLRNHSQSQGRPTRRRFARLSKKPAKKLPLFQGLFRVEAMLEHAVPLAPRSAAARSVEAANSPAPHGRGSRVRFEVAEQRGRSGRNTSGSWGRLLLFEGTLPPKVHIADDRLSALVHRDVLDPNGLIASAPVSLERL
jgi:hypothetical protein